MPGKLAQPTTKTINSFTCTFCKLCLATKPKTRRPFSTSNPLRAIPPESPDYVDVPQTVQPDLIRPYRPKGTLPVPRKLFPASRPDKPSPTYIANVTPDAKPSNVTPASHMTPLLSHRARMTSLRKSHLRSALLALHERKESMRASIAYASAAKQAESLRLRTQSQREDERLTSASVPESMRPAPLTHTLPSRAASLHARAARNVARRARASAREDSMALHALYMNARNFITTEEQLSAAIDAKFVSGEANKEWEREFQPGASIWNRGVPSTIAQLLGRGSGGQGSVSRRRGVAAPYESEVAARFRVDQERMKRIAEELSGGKI